MKKVNDKKMSLFGLLGRYRWSVTLLVALTIIANGLTILVPKIISGAVDGYTGGNFFLTDLLVKFSVVAVLIFLFTYLQNIVQVYVSERAARDLRNEIIAEVSVQPYSYISAITPAKLLTNLTSDIDAIKVFVSTAVSSLISSAFLIIGTSILLLLTDFKLAVMVLSIIPFLGLTFFFIFRKVRKLFTRSQEAIDWLNKVISESILGSSLIRLLNSQKHEEKKFLAASTEAKNISFEILKSFSSLVPAITFFTNVATLVIVIFGGKFVIQGTMSLGSFAAFNSYLAILIFPIMILGFISNLIAQAGSSYSRILSVLNTPKEKETGHLKAVLTGDIKLENITVGFGEKLAIKDVSFSVKGGEKTAIIGPTAAGKTQILYLLAGLLDPKSGKIYFDNKEINEYEKENLRHQVGIVFQDSLMFNLSLRENIAFNNTVKDEDLAKAIEAAELSEYINSLPEKLDTIVSERGTSLSGGQKQRIMLARALALDPKILLLDDFTARVDSVTEKKILNNIEKKYPKVTLISVTQKISPIESYDQIILLMEGELLAKGTHQELLSSSPEYAQIYQSQRSTNQYE